MASVGFDIVMGVEFNKKTDQLFSCRFCVLAKKGNTLTVEHKETVEGNLTTVLAALPKKYPVAITLSGKGIVHKNLQAAEDNTEQQLFSTAFPSIEVSQFYTQVFRENTEALVSIVRKQEVDELLNKVLGVGLKVYRISIGGIVSRQIWPQIESGNNTIGFDGHLFGVDSKKNFVTYKQLDSEPNKRGEIKLGTQPMPEELLLAYASAFQLILHEKLGAVKASVERIDEYFETALADAKLKRMALLFLFSFFGLLLVSFLLFSYYNQKNLELSANLGSKLASIDQSDLLKKNIAENEALLKQLNWNKGYNYGFLVDEIGKSMPRQLTLNEISFNEQKTEEEKQLRNPTIKLTGSTNNLTAVNNWIFVLKEKSWVKAVKLVRYQEFPESTDYQFNLVINY